MTRRTELTIEELLLCKNLELEPSSWRTIEQERVNAFADATDDHQWIHVDVPRATQSVWGGTIAHGYLVLSLVPVMLEEILKVTNQGMGVNYGIDKVRFTAPVPVGSNVRMRATIKEAHERAGGAQYILDITVEVEDSEKPALAGQIVFLALP